MKPPTKKQALRLLPGRLAALLGFPLARTRVHPRLVEASQADAVIEAGGSTFVVEWKGSAGLAQIANAVTQAQRNAAILGKRAVPLIAVPFMGPSGRDLCERANVGWLDLSGNAHVVAPGLRISVNGQPNRFKSLGRPASAFAPKSARIARWLLMHPTELFSQRELAAATGMDEGFTSRIVSRLEANDLIIRDPGGRVRARDPNLLLDAWAESYSFAKHHVLRGHVSARSGEALLRSMASVLGRKRAPYAATGLAAAWLLDKFAGFRVVTIYLAETPEPALLKQLGFRESGPGANTWLVVPNDEGVFQGAAAHEGVQCVHAVQAYLDLKEQPERAKEAAEQLRRGLLRWTVSA